MWTILKVQLTKLSYWLKIQTFTLEVCKNQQFDNFRDLKFVKNHNFGFPNFDKIRFLTTSKQTKQTQGTVCNMRMTFQVHFPKIETFSLQKFRSWTN